MKPVRVERPATFRVPVRLAALDIVCPLIVPEVTAPPTDSVVPTVAPAETVRLVVLAVVKEAKVVVALVVVELMTSKPTK